ncbi:MAG: hypothetical protein IH956_06820 [Chloroflexi bacterium]|nr:hypothetical protein [Chloroflexota bacterium]
MARRNDGRSGFVFPVATALGFPVIIIGGKLILGDALPLQAMAVMFGAYALALVWAAMGMTFVDEGAPANHEVASAAPAQTPGLELLYTVPLQMAPATVGVVGAAGSCPWGLVVGDRLEVDALGRLSRPLCKTAVEALSAALRRSTPGSDFNAHVSCRCPLAGGHRTFEVGAPSAALSK